MNHRFTAAKEIMQGHHLSYTVLIVSNQYQSPELINGYESNGIWIIMDHPSPVGHPAACQLTTVEAPTTCKSEQDKALPRSKT